MPRPSRTSVWKSTPSSALSCSLSQLRWYASSRYHRQSSRTPSSRIQPFAFCWFSVLFKISVLKKVSFRPHVPLIPFLVELPSSRFFTSLIRREAGLAFAHRRSHNGENIQIFVPFARTQGSSKPSPGWPSSSRTTKIKQGGATIRNIQPANQHSPAASGIAKAAEFNHSNNV
jgi:hypothetical protein